MMTKQKIFCEICKQELTEREKHRLENQNVLLTKEKNDLIRCAECANITSNILLG